ncbi:hypothetical protein [Streptococcus sp. sy010]|uniref:hypothetical protein n=1 Tax=Streptococcus sp. sy010 TaxID=2600148 RepID=UPI0011B855C1|nr:hypothetical protein [Streptococcus sp. sy010]TWT16695.1 hypothetical protein FRX51_01935 [Streptococcus sp. sy010]
MSIYVKDFLEKILRDLNKDNFKVREKISQFLLDNNWFGISVNTDNKYFQTYLAENDYMMCNIVQSEFSL